MRVTTLGHASLLIETSDQRILVDPVVRPTLAGGALTFYPRRVLRATRIPPPTVLVITHGHFDHFDPTSLARFTRHIPVLVGGEDALVRGVGDLGFTNVVPLDPWQRVSVGRTLIEGTPSNWTEPEVGVLLRDDQASIWDMADSEPDPEAARHLVEEHGRVDVVATKFQPVNRCSVNYLFGQGATFEKAEVFRWLEAACSCNPSFVFPSASGLAFAGRHGWFNRYSFPFAAEEAARLLQQRLGPAGESRALKPGDVLEVDETGIRCLRQASDFVREVPGRPPRWEPVDASTLATLPPGAQRADLQRRLEDLLFGPLALWLGDPVLRRTPWFATLVSYGIVWQLVIHVGPRERLHYTVDFRSGEAEITRGEHADANCFEHISGRMLLEVLRGEAPGRFLLLGAVRLYEKIVAVRDGAFWAPPLQGAELYEQIGEPLVYFLRRFAHDGSSAPAEQPPGSATLALSRALPST